MLAEAAGHTTEYLCLHDPEEAAAKRDGHAAWTVAWESGPSEWAVNLTAGESIYRAELGMGFGTTPEVVGFHDQDDWIAEPHYSFDLQFSEAGHRHHVFLATAFVTVFLRVHREDVVSDLFGDVFVVAWPWLGDFGEAVRSDVGGDLVLYSSAPCHVCATSIRR